MKPLHPFLFAACLFWISTALSQDCANYLPFQKGNIIEYTITDKKGNPKGKSQYLVNDVNVQSGEMVADITSTLTDAKGKQLSTSNFTYSCTPQGIAIDLKSMLSDQMLAAYKDKTIKMQGGSMSIPYDAAVGSTLPDVNMHIDILEKDKMFAVIDVNLSNRKVEAKEDVTTAAGTFPSIRISYDSQLSTENMNMGMPVTAKGVAWYSEKVGMVKENSFTKEGKPTTSMVLTRVTK